MIEEKTAKIKILKKYVVKGELTTYLDAKWRIHNKVSKAFDNLLEAKEFSDIIYWLNPTENHIFEEITKVVVDFEEDESSLEKEFLNLIIKSIAE